jgi:hypothetical protein
VAKDNDQTADGEEQATPHEKGENDAVGASQPIDAPSTGITIGELRRRAAANPDSPEAESARRLSESVSKALDARGIAEKVVAASGLAESSKKLREQIATSTGASRMTEDLAKSFRSPAIDNLARQQREMTEWQERQRREMEDISRSVAEAKRRQEDRADAQAEATIAIADAQQRLQELQSRGVELATAQAEATAQVARSQQELLSAIHEELNVLREQHATLHEQVEGQRRLIHSGWAGGVVMEWTLLVAIIAAVASVVLGVADAKDIPATAWVLAAGAIVAASLALAVSQRRRKPGDD